MNEISLATDQDNDKDEFNNKVTLMTVHSAKGLEFKNVQLGSDYFWNKKQEEPLMVPAEARLLYVACTRAMEKLDISNMQPLFNRLFANKIRS